MKAAKRAAYDRKGKNACKRLRNRLKKHWLARETPGATDESRRAKAPFFSRLPAPLLCAAFENRQSEEGHGGPLCRKGGSR